jgi:hypothetical protein
VNTHIDPTSRGDMVADLMRRWYEANRESWWDRHKPGIIGAGPDRSGRHADEFMLRLISEVLRLSIMSTDNIYKATGEKP